MNKKFLIIGAKPVSEATIQVLELLTSHDYVTINPFSPCIDSELEKLKDDNEIQGLVLVDHEGVELSKHIRLTESLGNLRLLPIMILSPHSLEHHLREKRDNIFLLSPEVYLISISECIAELLNVMEKARHFESQKKMCADLKPFIVWSEEDDIVSSHDNFNRYGPFRLMQEHFGGLPEFMSAQYGDISSKLWFKKYRFLESNSITAEALQVDEEQFRKTIANKKVLYIDDEHRLGWSFALYSLFTGNSDQSHYQVFQDSASVISTPDSRFTSIDNVQDARNVIETYHDALSRALAEYSDAEHHRNRLAVDTSDIRKNTREIEDKVKSAEASVSRAGTSLREAEEKIRELNESFKKTLDLFLDDCTKGTGDVGITDLSPRLKEVANIFEQHSKEAGSYAKYKDEYRRNKDIFEKHKAELERIRPDLADTGEKNSRAIRRYDEAIRALSQGRMFPYDLVILDLRLERLLDKDRAPSEISGVQVLKRIKEIDPSIPVLMFTASEKAMNYQQAIGLGASGYWIKAVNSLSALKSEIIQSLEKAHEARNLWLGIRKVEAKKQLTYIRESQNSQELEKGTLSDGKKAEIIQLLKESFLLFMKELSPYEQTVYTYNHYAKIVLNMGMIQEERFSRLQDKRWDFWVNRKAREIDQEEITIRQLRNKAAHRAGAGITYQEALGVFHKTVERCLKA